MEEIIKLHPASEWRCKDVVLGTYEIENAIWKTSYLNYVDRYYNYIDTSICYNNDYVLKDLLKNKYIRVISKIPPQMYNHYEYMVTNHLRCLGRKYIDIMLIHNSRSDKWKDLALKLKDDARFKEVGVSNFNIDQIEEYKSIVGEYPSYNEMEINPEYYDLNLIQFCHDKGIKIIAYAILGGKYNARRNIATYTLPYLLEFAGRNAELIITRSDDYIRLDDMRFYVDMHKKLDIKVNGDIFNVKSSTDKSIKPTEYSGPKYYTKTIYPTNSDKMIYFEGVSICNGFVFNGDQSSDVLEIRSKFLEGAEKDYEFISDLRVMARYVLDNYMHEVYGKWPEGEYPYPSTYLAKIKRTKWFRDKSIYHHVSVNLLTESGGLTKVNDGKSKLIIESK